MGVIFLNLRQDSQSQSEALKTHIKISEKAEEVRGHMKGIYIVMFNIFRIISPAFFF